jgi:hypothetical protein
MVCPGVVASRAVTGNARGNRRSKIVIWTEPAWRVPTIVSDRAAPRSEERSRMEARPNEPGTPGTDREEGHFSRAPSNRRSVSAHPQKPGAGFEEDWSSLGTDDPAFWLKEPEQE